MAAAERTVGVRRVARVAAAVGLVVMLVLAAQAAASGQRPARICGTKATKRAPAHVAHVVWIWFENKDPTDVLGTNSAPYFDSLAARCGLATNYTAVAHPSLPNYIAATSGSTQGITDDDNPPSHPLEVPSVFGQVASRSYAQSMPAPCTLSDDGRYAVRHVPQVYYLRLRSRCSSDVLPLDQFDPKRLPPFTFITPDMCSDMHNCPVAKGDSWLHGFLPQILGTRDYLAGRTVVFITFDEADKNADSNQVPMLVLSQWTPAGIRSTVPFSHYSLLRTTEDLLDVPHLGHANHTYGMRSSFHL